MAAPNRCPVDLGEPEKEELLAVGKEEGREGRHFFLTSLPAFLRFPFYQGARANGRGGLSWLRSRGCFKPLN